MKDIKSYISKWSIAVAIAAIVTCILSLAFIYTEDYVPLFPYIDTHFTPSFDWEGYTTVKPGMAQERVVELLGQPYEKGALHFGYYGVKSGQYEPKEDEPCWMYSDDGGWAPWDFAWIGVQVCFDNKEHVKGKNELIFYN